MKFEFPPSREPRGEGWEKIREEPPSKRRIKTIAIYTFAMVFGLVSAAFLFLPHDKEGLKKMGDGLGVSGPLQKIGKKLGVADPEPEEGEK